MIQAKVDVSIRGETKETAALEIAGRLFVVDGRIFTVARLHDEKWLEDELEDLPSLLEQLRPQRMGGHRIDAFSFVQKLPDLNRRFDFPMVLESVAAIPITTYQDWMDRLQRDSRTDVRKAEKRGIRVTTSELDEEFVQGIAGIYNEAPTRQGKRFWHYGKPVETVRRENSTYCDRSVFLGAYHDAELVGFMKIVAVGGVGVMMQILSRISHRDYRVSNALVAAAVRLAEERKWRYLTYGQYRYRNQDSSLTSFKHRAGFQEYLLPRYYVPLNRWGRMCLRLGLHRDLGDRVPPTVATIGRYIRARYSDIAARSQ